MKCLHYISHLELKEWKDFTENLLKDNSGKLIRDIQKIRQYNAKFEIIYSKAWAK